MILVTRGTALWAGPWLIERGSAAATIDLDFKFATTPDPKNIRNDEEREYGATMGSVERGVVRRSTLNFAYRKRATKRNEDWSNLTYDVELALVK